MPYAANRPMQNAHVTATASDALDVRAAGSTARGRAGASRRAVVRTVPRRAVVESLALVLAAALMGCGRSSPNASPESATREFVERASSYEGDPEHAEALLRLLSSRTRQNLQVRADRYGAASGRTIDPSAMLVPSRLTLRFPPRSYRARVAGDRAMVEVRGSGPDERAEIPCVLEEGKWYVDLPLPELPPMRKRQGDEP